MGFLRELRTRLGIRRSQPNRAQDFEVNRLGARLWQRAIDSSAAFVEEHLTGALIFGGNGEIRSYALEQAPKTGMLLEFGVFQGDSISAFARRLTETNDPRPIFGFDAFRGLMEDWTGHFIAKEAYFNRDGMPPEIPANVRLVEGWVEDTLPAFLEENSGTIAFIHIDTDTYKPCSTILRLCVDRLAPGSLILFDELLSYPGWRHGEFKALQECLSPERYGFRAFEGERALIEIV